MRTTKVSLPVVAIGVGRHGVGGGAGCLVPNAAAWTASSYEALRASSLSICSLSKPTIQRLPILITGTPLCPVLRTISRAASASRSMLISLNGTPRSLKYRFALRHQEHVDVLNSSTLDI